MPRWEKMLGAPRSGHRELACPASLRPSLAKIPPGLRSQSCPLSR